MPWQMQSVYEYPRCRLHRTEFLQLSKRREANKMRAFEYANPTTKEQAVGLLGSSWADAEVLAGGTDLLSLMKDDIVHPKRLVNIKGIPELRAIKAAKTGLS